MARGLIEPPRLGNSRRTPLLLHARAALGQTKCRLGSGSDESAGLDSTVGSLQRGNLQRWRDPPTWYFRHHYARGVTVRDGRWSETSMKWLQTHYTLDLG